MIKAIKFFWLVVLVLFTQSTKAEVFEITHLQPEYELTDHLEIFFDQSQSLSFEKIQSLSADFVPFENWENIFLPQSIYWGKINLSNQISSTKDLTEWVIHFSLIFTDLEVYAVYPNGTIEQHRTGFFVSPTQRTFTPIVKGNMVKVHLPAEENVMLYFKAINKRSSIPTKWDVTLQHSTTFFSHLEKQKQWNAMFIGFVLMMFVYNLFLFLSAKDRAYVDYSIYLFAITVYTAYNSGDLADWLNRLSLQNNPELIYYFKLTIYLILASYVSFIRHFLDLKKLLPWWNSLFKIFWKVSIPLVFIDGFIMWYFNYSYNISDILTTIWIFVFLLLCFSFLVPLYKSKDPKGFFIITGFTFTGIGILMTIWLRLQSVDFSVIYFRVGIILEIILFSLGLAYRQKEMEQEKQAADFELEKTKILQDIEHKEAERLKELNNMKSRLYANITHEFRTPLTVIMGMADNINQNEKAKELIQRNSKNLLQLINQLLDLSKAESGILTTNMAQGDIINFLRYLTESFHSMASAKDIQLTFYSEEKELIMDFDEQKTQHIIYNLLSNAIKYTPQKGKVIFHVKKDNEHLIIKVKDNGLGISEKDQQHVFDRFYKVDNSSTQKVDGVGIGLALTKELVELLNGTILLRSELGEGSEFFIQLPITNLATEVNISKAENMMLKNLLQSDENEINQQSTIAKENSNKDLPVLLVIEDNEDVVTYIQSCLADEYQVTVALDGEVGVQKAFEIVPDVIISDLMMPKKDGFEVCNILKKDQKTSHIPIILLTAKASQDDKIEGLETGADAYMMKPFNKKELKIRLKKLVENRVALQAKYEKGLFPSSKKPENLDDEFLQKLLKVIEGELDNPNLSVGELSKKLHLSSTQMYRKLKALTGAPPTKFIRQFRLQKGLELLRTTSKTIAEIAYQVGFNDPNYFSRAFSEEFGKTPSDIRK